MERRKILFLALFVIFFTTLPYLVGYLRQSEEWRYTGLLIAAEDGNSYLAKMLLGASGDWLFRTPYTAYPQKGFLAFFPYILLGKLTSPPGQYSQLIALFHLFRVGGIVFCIWATYRFVSGYFSKFRDRFLAVVLATLGGGLGFVYLLGGSSLWGGGLPLEFYSPETFGFLSFLAIPHLLWARGFLFWGLTKYFHENLGESFGGGVKAGAIWNLTGLMQPFTIVVGWAVLAIHVMIEILYFTLQKNRPFKFQPLFWIKRAVGVGLVSSPFVIYTFVSFRVDPFLKQWEKQNIILSPAFGDYLLAYGILLPLALLGVWRWIRESDVAKRFIISWVLFFPVLAYAPYNLQRRLPEGVFVALSILAVTGFSTLSGKLRSLAKVWLALGGISSLLLVGGGVLTLLNPAPPLYYSADEQDLFHSMQACVPRSSVVLADWDLSNLLPAHVPVRVIIGHGPESLRAIPLKQAVETFFKGAMDEQEVRRFLRNEHVDYLIVRNRASVFSNWQQEPFLKLMYRNPSFELYQVIEP
ncbi:hypothetical protein [Anaerolinea thermophila]|uniref:Hypothetical membrane protein n=1 Tax=Anaerolinea thermophila (strain DSM 14523 / JCM 11388 / NBRC 100420 / UNI-1) TaxID=926569 RepID=E8N600_ANATU|nr:hypothetical protein [Anaerolinea thermophila]BAJ63864.1 hypothetical membrane protein [Anaerolinea thermophila UNI-1]